MAGRGRVVAAVAAGAIAWFLLWTGGNWVAQSTFPDIVDPTRRLDHVGALWGFITYSVLASLVAGYTTAAVARSAAAMAVGLLATVQLGLGIFFEVSYWDLMPAWYHLVFLALIVPATVYGGRLRGS